MKNSVIVWHFADKKLRDGSDHPEAGFVFPHIDNPKPCTRGYHGSEDILDALQYAAGTFLCRRGLSGVIIPHGDPLDKLCASDAWQETPYVDVSDLLVRFARYCALTALRVDAANSLRKAGLIEHANTLSTLHDNCDMAASGDAAWAAARAAAWASGDAARTAARTAAWAASGDAAWAAVYAARTAASAAAWDAAWAAGDAARAAARASGDAGDSRRNEQRAWLLKEL